MKLITLGSSSAGNGYLLQSETETLIIEAGIRLSTVKKALDFNLRTVVGVIISHKHGDHAKYLEEYAKAGIMVLTSLDVLSSQKVLVASTLCKEIKAGKGYKVGGFKIVPFDVCHDVPCLGFLISHPESGNVLFLTDTFMCEYTFENINHFMIEANYADDILEDNITIGTVHPSMRFRLLQTHMELKTVKGIITANINAEVRNIVLIHLSSGNSQEDRFVREIQEMTGIPVFAAKKNQEINFNLNPY
jgi:phosphoribosyl 1,2-cyclic phosphodiesterase